MATEAQIKANRENSKKSTGPKTPEGKAISSRNAKQPGTSSRFHELTYTDRPAYAILAKAFIADLKPVGIFEESLVETIIDNQWQLNRVRARSETQCYEFSGGTRNMNELIRHQKHLEDSIRKTEVALRARQKFRIAEEQYEQMVAWEIDTGLSHKGTRNGHFKRKVGFVYEKSQLIQYYDRLEEETSPKPEKKTDPPGETAAVIG